MISMEEIVSMKRKKTELRWIPKSWVMEHSKGHQINKTIIVVEEILATLNLINFNRNGPKGASFYTSQQGKSAISSSFVELVFVRNAQFSTFQFNIKIVSTWMLVVSNSTEEP